MVVILLFVKNYAVKRGFIIILIFKLILFILSALFNIWDGFLYVGVVNFYGQYLNKYLYSGIGQAKTSTNYVYNMECSWVYYSTDFDLRSTLANNHFLLPFGLENEFLVANAA